MIGIFAIKSAGTEGTTYTTATPYTPTDDAYTVSNAKLTLTNGTWVLTDAEGNANVDFGDADLLLAYRPYRADAKIPAWTSDDYVEGRPSFIGAKGSWDINTVDNRFFVHPYNENWDTSTIEKFENADWMGDAASVDSNTKEVTFNMTHMRGMVELTTDKNVKLTEMLVGFGENAAGNKFVPYFVNENDDNRTKNIYRILTTEYRNPLTIYAAIEDLNIVKKYRKVINNDAYKKAGVRYCVNINYTPAETITVGAGQSLAAILTEKYGADYATNGKVTTLRLAGELQGTIPTDGNWTNIKDEDSDWATLRSLTTLKSLDMYQLTNTSLPKNWLKGDAAARTALTSLVLPSKLKIIGGDALQVANVANIDVPATVTEIGTGAFWGCSNLSVRIPEGSALATVGNGVFYNVKAVYTYESNLNVLVLPETLSSIGQDGAFYSIDNLRKVVFKGETAPNINNNGTAAFANTNATIYVPNKANYYGKSLFPGKTVFVGPVLTADNYASSYTYLDSDAPNKGIPALCDGPADTFWHSDYNYYHDYDQWGIYIDITLPKEYSNLKVSYTSRFNSTYQLPKKVRIGVSADGENFNETNVYDAAALATTKNETKELAITATSSYKKVRFGVIRSVGGGNSYNPETEKDDINNQDENGYYIAENKTQAYVYTALSELTVYEETWTE